MRNRLLFLMLLGAAAIAAPAQSQTRPSDQPLQVEWVYRIKYGFQDEWWTLFKKYQIATLDREKQLGYVTDYQVFRPGAHTSEDSRWDYRIIITYPNYDGSKREAEVERQLFTDRAALTKDENRRWELTLDHWDLPIRQIDPHEDRD
jgi:hypothetical protein